MTTDEKCVDVLIATYNEENNLKDCINAVLNQTYNNSKINIFIIDGGSTDNTIEIVKKFVDSNKNIKLLMNSHKFQAFGWNQAILCSSSPYISIISAHSIISPDYIKSAINILQNDEISLAGGHMIAKGSGSTSSAIAKLHHSKFGIGVGKFHDINFEGFTDTVYMFNLKRNVLNKNGLFNTKLHRNQDIELTGRIRANGGKVYLSNSLNAIYIPNNSISSFLKKYYNNSKFIFITLDSTIGVLSIRHFVPLFFILFIPVSIYFCVSQLIPFFSTIFSLIWLTYLIINFIYSNRLANSIKEFLLLFILHPMLHIIYGLGTLLGGIQIILNKK